LSLHAFSLIGQFPIVKRTGVNQWNCNWTSANASGSWSHILHVKANSHRTDKQQQTPTNRLAV